MHDFFLSCKATTTFDIGNDVASHVTSLHLHFGDENFPCPIFMVPKLNDVSSNVFSVAERAHWMTQNRSSHPLTWGFSLSIADVLQPSTIICQRHAADRFACHQPVKRNPRIVALGLKSCFRSPHSRRQACHHPRTDCVDEKFTSRCCEVCRIYGFLLRRTF